ncbi:MAG: DNA-processing protein DprA [Actinomycetota bacterium]|nr:DNA-processing protein DprA [Actinomycetota bacterium]
MSDRVARAALSRLVEPGDTRLARLVGQLGAARVYDLLRAEEDIAGVYTDVAARLRGLDPERELEEAASRGIRFICPGDPEWPIRLDDLDRAEPLQGRGGVPLGLWARGPLSLGDACRMSAAVVGSRSATSYGTQVASEIAAALASEGVGVVSGAAFGIDQAAHRAALAMKGQTVAVLACGVDRPYPAAHKQLLDYIVDVGVVVSELPPGCSPTRLRFLSRNRVIAALTLGTVIVEAAVRSGALNTANWASRLNRVLMGVPGPVTSAPSEGVHQLIRYRGASLVTKGADVLELVSPTGDFVSEEVRGTERPRDRLTEREQRILDAVPLLVGAPPVSIARTAGVAASEVHPVLVSLRSKGFLEESEGRWRLAAQSQDDNDNL